MCLAAPGEVLKIEGSKAKVSFSGAVRAVDLSLVSGVKPGDYVLVHAGCAIQILPPEEARETIGLFEEVFSATDSDQNNR
ncbi:MAG: HypC/HybG/HupF family hydrogenase formation chaperone [Firmicutes bacterium]|nr:HypC/HybG/HupF family hydrogenase formation chaperone [Bacillota bacterium]